MDVSTPPTTKDRQAKEVVISTKFGPPYSRLNLEPNVSRSPKTVPSFPPFASILKRQPIHNSRQCSTALRVPVFGADCKHELRSKKSPEKEHATMENHANQSPAIPKWSALLIEAVTKPGLIMKAYSDGFDK